MDNVSTILSSSNCAATAAVRLLQKFGTSNTGSALIAVGSVAVYGFRCHPMHSDSTVIALCPDVDTAIASHTVIPSDLHV